VYGGMAMLVFAALAGYPGAEWERTPFPPPAPPLPRSPALRLGPVRAAALALGLFSLSGIPPTPGFWAKLAVLVAAWQSAGPLATLIAVAGGVFSVLYYLRPLPDLFAAMRATAPAGPARPVPAPAIALATVLVVALGLFPGVAWTLARGLPPGS
jgi:NADH:ubiquinone oxidoreductase subunit 2 (subunit N)